jgi:hypothetical protein
VLTTLAADRPLTFLDHHLAVGNSCLAPVWRTSAEHRARRARAGGGWRESGSCPLFDDNALRQLARAVVPERLQLALDASTTPAAVRDKERRLDTLRADESALTAWARAADLCAGSRSMALEASARPLPGDAAAGRSRLPTTLPLSTSRPRASGDASARAHAPAMELTFRKCSRQDGQYLDDPGFDAVLGNHRGK